MLRIVRSDITEHIASTRIPSPHHTVQRAGTARSTTDSVASNRCNRLLRACARIPTKTLPANSSHRLAQGMHNSGDGNRWRDHFKSLTEKAEFNAPASGAAIFSLEEALVVRLPAELADALKESDGVSGEYGLGLLWPVERIKQDNQRFRQHPGFKDLYMPFDCLLFFGDAGNGDQFAYIVLQGEVHRGDIFVWNHENDSRTWVAPSLKVFYDG